MRPPLFVQSDRGGDAPETPPFACKERVGNAELSAGPVVHVRDTALPLEDPGALQLDLLGSEALEQTAPLAEEHRDQMDLELVEYAGGERELRGCADRGSL
jgi:hypothetical protein